MKYSKRFDDDYNWFLSVSGIFTFDGVKTYYNKKGIDVVQTDLINGKSAKECFYLYDSQGKIFPCNEPELLEMLLKVKGSVNLHIKMYAEDRAKGLLPKFEFLEYSKEFNAPKWFIDAVENQKFKYY